MKWLERYGAGISCPTDLPRAPAVGRWHLVRAAQADTDLSPNDNRLARRRAKAQARHAGRELLVAAPVIDPLDEKVAAIPRELRTPGSAGEERVAGGAVYVWKNDPT